ncbi:hypothetical protein BH20ACI3_BH20ACI3_18420 [soil metagenome]
MTERQDQTGAVDTEDQLRARVADCEARLEEIAELVARVRHEINNPLTGVLGQSQLLLREELNDKARKRAHTIEDLAIRMRDIVAQLRPVQLEAQDSKSLTSQTRTTSSSCSTRYGLTAGLTSASSAKTAWIIGRLSECFLEIPGTS